MDSHAVIASQPVAGADRIVLIKAANAAFERVIERIEPANEELTRTLWDAEGYIDNEITADMLPISRDEAAYLIDVFLVHMSSGWLSQQTTRPPNPGLEPRRRQLGLPAAILRAAPSGTGDLNALCSEFARGAKGTLANRLGISRI
ncbi:hypothetical protein [Mesorhizobium argentiipisi]|uniref:Uncharacterized protein n=1 Tax=Mesorhizobium argentiipisi TaxID=3015175 RepID=A0ABU8KF74_9HYPH